MIATMSEVTQEASPRHGAGQRARPSTQASMTAALRASRALVAIAARSMAGLTDITLAQYRALVVLAQQGPMRAGDLAEALGVQPSSCTRLADRLVHKALIERRPAADSRREVEISLSPAGHALVSDVAQRRVAELGAVLDRAGHQAQDLIIRGFEAFADAAGELADDDWAIPWN